MALPPGITREHVERALHQLAAGVPHPFGASSDYDLVADGKRYAPKAVAGLAASLASGRDYGPADFSGGDGPGSANAVLRSLGFVITRKDTAVVEAGGSVGPAFTADDCTLFDRNQSGKAWDSITPGDQDGFKDLRRRLKSAAEHLAPRASRAGLPFASVASLPNPNGRVPREIWSCVFPRSVGNKSFALQFALIINGQGAEVCCCLGSGSSQDADPERVRQNRADWISLQARLRSVSPDLRHQLEAQLHDRWQLRRSWLLEPGRRDFANMSEWLGFAASAQGAGASISRNLSPDELEGASTRMLAELTSDIELFLPLFGHLYDASATPGERETLGGGTPGPLRLHPRVEREIRAIHRDMTGRGELISAERLQQTYASFKERFGPAVLRELSGEPLLKLIKGFDHDGLIYWLEFKDDDEFPAAFGSIAGGSAFKYAVYKKRETGAWTTGTPTAQREISVAEAVRIATEHRDQLLQACQLVAALPEDAAEEDYARLQNDLVRLAPDVQDSAWGHKYLSLLFPQRLDDYHAVAYQRFHLVRLLQEPSSVEGRYVNAGRFVLLQRHLGWPMNHVTTVLNRRHGSPYRYWRIGTTAGDAGQSYWDAMRTKGVVSIGWSKLGNLSTMLGMDDPKDAIKKKLDEAYPADPRVTGRAAQQITHFCRTIKEGDYVVASDGATALGIGRVTGGYEFGQGEAFPHRRSVEWLSLGAWQLPTTEGLRTTVYEYRKRPENLIAIEQRVLDVDAPTPAPPDPPVIGPTVESRPLRWTAGGMVGRIQDVLTRKGQVILYGPPGTGKTHWAEIASKELAALWNAGAAFNTLDANQQAAVLSASPESFVRYCSFHPGYGYEDFIEGYRPVLVEGSIRFELRDGVFKRLCDAARRHPHRRYYLIIDEINRGDIPRIFGELLTLLEMSKRDTPVLLPLSGAAFTVPRNVFVIGTMNTADRSIALLDAALRRRFGFIELLPDVSVLGSTAIHGIALGAWLGELNRRIATHIGRDGRNLQVGHSYFLADGRPIQEVGQLIRVLQEDVLPLLEEYCYDDWPTLQRLLPGLVNASERCFRVELFAANRVDDLIQAMMSSMPEVATSSTAVAAEALASGSEPEDDDADADVSSV